MRVYLPLLFFALLSLAGCTSPKSTFPISGWSTSLTEIAKLRKGDTAEIVIQKLGAPMHVEVILPWLMYEAADRKGFYYRVSFTLKEIGKLQLDDRVERVTLTSGIGEGPDSKVVWPGIKTEANQALEHNAYARHASCGAAVAPSTGVAHL